MVNSIHEYIDRIIKLKSSWFPEDNYPDIWYRGINDTKYDLEPGAYWRPGYDEISAVSTFRTQVPTLLNDQPTDDWDWYFLMQHYNLPTRLLDWTESPLQALHFALSKEMPESNPAVWVLDPVALNYSTQEIDYICIPQGFKDLIEDNKYEIWLPQTCYKDAAPITSGIGKSLKSNEYPIALVPSRSIVNRRLHAQRGVFTLHGTSIKPINHYEIINKEGAQRLTKIEICENSRVQLLNELWTLGINESSTYPEPNKLSSDILKMYGHEVKSEVKGKLESTANK